MTTPNHRPGPSPAGDDDPPSDAQRAQAQPVAFLLTVPEAAARLRIGRTLMYELITTGEVDSVTVGRLRRIRPIDLETYVAGLERAPVVPVSRRLERAA